MKVIVLLIIVLSTQMVMALNSPMPSSLGLDLPNSHQIGRQVYRGQSPDKYLSELKALEITDVLIFKNDTKGEVLKLKQDLQSQGFSSQQIHQIEFKWKEIESSKQACAQAVKGLQLLAKIEASRNKRIFFHCTVGEDRTGMLAGLFRMINDSWSVDRAFNEEMCARGYEAGNKQKPRFVVNTIRKELTPIFFAMAKIIESKGSIELKDCDNLQLNTTVQYCK